MEMKTGYKILICTGLCLLSAFFASFSQILMLPLLALAGFVGACWGIGYMLPVFPAMLFGIAAGLGIGVGTLPTAVMLVLIPVILAVCERKRIPHRYTLLMLAVVYCLGIYLSLTLGSMLQGEAPYAELVRSWQRIGDDLHASFGQDANAADMLESFDNIGLLIPDTLMFVCVFMAEATAFALIMMFRLWQKLFRAAPRRMVRFPHWRLPSSALWGGLIMGAGIGLVYAFDLNQANSIALTLGLIISSLFSVQGMAYFAFMFEATGTPKLIRAFLWIGVAVTFPFSLILLTFTGIKEQITKRRSKITRLAVERRQRMAEQERRDEFEKYGYIRRQRGDEPHDDNDDGDGSR